MFATEAFRLTLRKGTVENISLASILNFMMVDFVLSHYCSRPCKGSKHKYTVLLLAPVLRTWLCSSVTEMKCLENVVSEILGWTKHGVLNRINAIKLLPPVTEVTQEQKRKKKSHWIPSSIPFKISFSSSSVYSQKCSFQLSPFSLRRITSSLSFPRRAAKWGISTITGLAQQHSALNAHGREEETGLTATLLSLLQSDLEFYIFRWNTLALS